MKLIIIMVIILVIFLICAQNGIANEIKYFTEDESTFSDNK